MCYNVSEAVPMGHPGHVCVKEACLVACMCGFKAGRPKCAGSSRASGLVHVW